MSTGQQLKLSGMTRAADSREVELLGAKCQARILAYKGRQITVDDIREVYRENMWKWNLGNAAGSIFKGQEWECVGFAVSAHPEAHGRIVRKWKLRQGNT